MSSDTRPAIIKAVERWHHQLGPRPFPDPDTPAAHDPETPSPDRHDPTAHRTGTEHISIATKRRLLAAAEQARSRYPGSIGELLSQELHSWMVFGHHLGSTLIMQVANNLLETPYHTRDSVDAASGRTPS